ncbi:hypothetical protein [Streptomyces halstedii]|uniref:Uncharacterized protein n=1 Tax=Streptomyces halstedii TaxID=1944 RepID=A0A6N9UCM7_STRHA|nr:hypothetical protein [Streptomyces halstedii]NEA19836.1 hypothetical protein [Streptomyces halstedii]
MSYRARRAAHREARILASLPPVPVPADEDRSPDYCFTCGRRCGSQPHK